jgi:hypothetical protein
MDSLIILPTKEPDMTFHLDSTLKRISEPTKKLLSVIKSEDNTPSTETNENASPTLTRKTPTDDNDDTPPTSQEATTSRPGRPPQVYSTINLPYRSYLYKTPHKAFRPHPFPVTCTECTACDQPGAIHMCTRCDLVLCSSCKYLMLSVRVRGNMMWLIGIVARWKLGYIDKYLLEVKPVIPPAQYMQWDWKKAPNGPSALRWELGERWEDETTDGEDCWVDSSDTEDEVEEERMEEREEESMEEREEERMEEGRDR